MSHSPLLDRIEAREARLAIIGLGYVGLPLAVEFGKHFDVAGFDISTRRLEELRAGRDRTLETTVEELRRARRLSFTNRIGDLKEVDVFIVTVPTPIDRHKRPDLTPLVKASETVGQALKPGAIVVYESTVYPGCTEEDCVPILEKFSGLKFNRDFFCGYSPERINPGDKVHTVTKIKKVTSGSTPEAGQAVDALYRTIIAAGTHLAPSIAVAEAAKVIENSQRDINIAFVNELSLIFERMGIDTQAVLEAAGTKWNFLPFRPGLVGGHCIGVDPYYLTHKAQALGYHPEIILAGRRLNDNMGAHVASRVVKLLIQKGHRVRDTKILVLGITFKENCPDIRNSHVVDVIRELQDFGCDLAVFDPWADAEEVRQEYGLDLLPALAEDDPFGGYDAVVLAVAHDKFKDLDFVRAGRSDVVLFDIKGLLPWEQVDGRL
ncbi:MAG: Vi polysaccharide biosynthesis UDP-N-acetylglucosamine C-6 dehydrogenase TviB [Kiritimatiellae bacterium]|jgi:UDP-N-acetyl-D-galactosamine dehydrogenase|nr:Vi polysaccharide biosynthesis UDP-N-acetylglucosamine C-6 dehydrogenase TviB [Kiritimatiellia bacterium]NLD90670.1 Vi polysaccharide biosynthesis UDP-N-acetylglucosamine C-6 dehydrogenase TviB [Lentisphaerota bacterium]HPC19793.1 Vi polysaccharide biosynthesis UDP-N-acetylglucosamine C-6 dehydrogenase TviB [Kiritimatiellia bacterium]HQN80162.1 Vi polysaccharide biosynthesis UDP-N-acetylglucosamine C-6 dehydrogenase TviB [Kiritimatiellia bacterium]HQQ60093.1 Vi polysaccharide biosynthesis UD